jgi:Tol biopolymer transport system component
MKDEAGVVQLWTVSLLGGAPVQLTHNQPSIGSAFTWSPNGRFIAHVMDNSVCVTQTATGATRRLTDRTENASAPRPEACVFSPDGTKIAYVRPMRIGRNFFNQLFVVAFSD